MGQKEKETEKEDPLKYNYNWEVSTAWPRMEIESKSFLPKNDYEIVGKKRNKWDIHMKFRD